MVEVAEQQVSNEPEESEDSLIKYVHELFKDFDKAKQDLNRIVESAETKTKTLVELITNSEKDVFGEESGEFLLLLKGLAGEIGHAGWEVLEIELRRQGVIHPQPQQMRPPLRKSTKDPTSPVQIIQAGQPQGIAGGVTGFLAQRQWAHVYEKYLRMIEERGRVAPDITTKNEVMDLLDFGRQLIPELNMIFEYHRRAVAHLTFFNDKATHAALEGELQNHLLKICTILCAFTQTSIDHRIENVGDRKRSVGIGILALEMAKFQAMGEFTTKDYYKHLQDTLPPQAPGDL